MRCCVVIPVHSLDMSDIYKASVINTMTILSNHDIFLMCPQSLVFDNKCFFYNTAMKVYNIEDKWMSSSKMYSKLCLQSWLYKNFNAYDYMLIVQPDAWVFNDQIEYWCNKNYDYIGAPWCHYCKKNRCCNYQNDPTNGHINVIGNGGLSLRKIKKFIEATEIIKNDVENIPENLIPNEDDYLLNNKKIQWNIPNCDEAIQFSIESMPAYHIKNGVKPFGYHNLLKVNFHAAFQLHFLMEIHKILLKQRRIK